MNQGRSELLRPTRLFRVSFGRQRQGDVVAYRRDIFVQPEVRTLDGAGGIKTNRLLLHRE